MAPRKCSLKGCGSVGLRCFGLPSQEDLKRLWVDWINEIFEGDILKKKHILICERHFKPCVIGNKRLLKGAVPSVFGGSNINTTNNKLVGGIASVSESCAVSTRQEVNTNVVANSCNDVCNFDVGGFSSVLPIPMYDDSSRNLGAVETMDVEVNINNINHRDLTADELFSRDSNLTCHEGHSIDDSSRNLGAVETMDVEVNINHPDPYVNELVSCDSNCTCLEEPSELIANLGHEFHHFNLGSCTSVLSLSIYDDNASNSDAVEKTDVEVDINHKDPTFSNEFVLGDSHEFSNIDFGRHSSVLSVSIYDESASNPDAVEVMNVEVDINNENSSFSDELVSGDSYLGNFSSIVYVDIFDGSNKSEGHFECAFADSVRSKQDSNESLATSEDFGSGKSFNGPNDHVKDACKVSRVQRKCFVKGCSNNNTSCRMFAFPRVLKVLNGKHVVDEAALQRCQKWIKFCGNKDIFSKEVALLYKYFYVCSAHFHQNDIECNARKQLKRCAVPSLNGTESLSDEVVLSYCNLIRSLPGFANVVNENAASNQNHDDSCHGYEINCLHQQLNDRLSDLKSLRSRRFSRKFENSMKCLSMESCSVCKEKYLNYPGKKRVHRNRKQCQKFSDQNKMDPGELPEELNGLTFIEEKLISRVHPVLSVFKLKGNQYGYRGNVINFSQDVQEFAKQLPHRIEDLSSIITVRFNDVNCNNRDFQVRAKKVRDALVWLKGNNEHYHSIDISDSNLEELPEDGNVYEKMASLNVSDPDDSEPESSDTEVMDDVRSSGVPLTSFYSQNEKVNAVLNWPPMSSDPVSEFLPGYIMCAYPTLFPYCNCDLMESREKEVKMHEYFKHFLSYNDDRFAKHPTFRFFAFNTWMRHTALRDGNVFVNKDHEFSKMNVEQLKAQLESDPKLFSKVMFMGSNLRGSKPFWKSRCGELRDMIEQIGLPTIFLTLSAADMYWPDLFRLLTGKNVSEISMRDRRKLIQD